MQHNLEFMHIVYYSFVKTGIEVSRCYYKVLVFQRALVAANAAYSFLKKGLGLIIVISRLVAANAAYS